MPTCCKSQTVVIFWNACHFQTVTPIPAFFISFSSDFIPSIQWHTWFSKLMPGSIIPFQILHMHRISHPAYHARFCIMLLVHCTVIDCWSFACVLALGRSGRRVHDRGTCWVWPYPQNHFYLCLLVVHSIAMPCYLPLAISCLPYCHVKPLTHLS